MKKLFLASKSPRRKAILEKAGIKFSIINSDYDEELNDKHFSYEKIETLAKNKAFGALNNIKEASFVLSADTVVVLDNHILTKPTDFDDALIILKSLSGKEHQVVTSLCLLDFETRKYILKSTTTKVEFNNLTEQMITNYIDNYKPFDKAGAYGIQELPAGFVKQVKGDKENVIGLSSKSVISAIRQLEILLPESQEKSACLQD